MSLKNKLFLTSLGCCASVLVLASSAASHVRHVHVNRASALELTAVSGVGPKLAAAIVAYRKSHGPFKSLAQMQQVRGISKHFLTKHAKDFDF